MHWINEYSLFLFDFDGLLVDTERLHYEAYRQALHQRGYSLSWDFATFCHSAHLSSEKLQQALTNHFPFLSKERWPDFYNEKKRCYMELLDRRGVKLMEGVEGLLLALEKKNKKRVVVTHSPLEQIHKIQLLHPILKTIPFWITREDYSEPKPSPQCYLKALELFKTNEDKVVGFEDTPRGAEALVKASVEAVIICPSDHPGFNYANKMNLKHFESFLLI